jgi:hypothetical protein
MIVFYSKSCESCAGNHALANMKNHCRRQGVDFQEHRTVLWVRYEQEANEIMKINKGLKLPFFYSTNSGAVLEGYSLTPLDTLQKLIKEDKDAEESIG